MLSQSGGRAPEKRFFFPLRFQSRWRISADGLMPAGTLPAIFVLVSLMTTGAAAQQNRYANDNKYVFRTPREAALGGANLAFARDASPLSNPAALALDRRSELVVSHAGYFGNAFSTTLGSLKGPVNERGGFGFSLGYALASDIVITSDLDAYADQDGVMHPAYDSSRLDYGMFSELQMYLKYAHRFRIRPGIRLGLGAAVHGMRRRLLDEAGLGIGVDLGAVAEFSYSGLRVSIAADDISTNYIYWNDEYHDQAFPHLRFGLGWVKEFPYVYGKILIAYRSADVLGNEGIRVTMDELHNSAEVIETDIVNNPGAALLGAIGVEYVIKKIVSFRAGVNPDGYAFGGGIALFDQRLGFDFAYAASDLPGSYFASIAYSW